MHETDKTRMITTTAAIFMVIFLIGAVAIWGGDILSFLMNLGPGY